MGINKLSHPLDANNSIPVKHIDIKHITANTFLKLDAELEEINIHKITTVEIAKTKEPVIVFVSELQFTRLIFRNLEGNQIGDNRPNIAEKPSEKAKI